MIDNGRTRIHGRALRHVRRPHGDAQTAREKHGYVHYLQVEEMSMERIEQTENLKQQLAVLKEVMRDHPGRTIDNIIMQIESRIKEREK